MPIDIAFFVMMAIAIFKGFSKGFVVAVFAFFALLIGLAAALKLSVVVTHYLQSVTGYEKWLPAASFVLVFLLVVLLVKIMAKIIEKALAIVMLGWLNIIGGILVYAIIFGIIFSAALFYAEKMYLVSPEAVKESYMYPYISPWGPKAIDFIGNIIPTFKGLFVDLQDFFGKISDQFIPKKIH
jgi:membrane protein required for colicin V production